MPEDSLRDYFAVMAELGKDGAELSPPSALEEVEVPPGNTPVSISVAHPSRNAVEADTVLDEGPWSPLIAMPKKQKNDTEVH